MKPFRSSKLEFLVIPKTPISLDYLVRKGFNIVNDLIFNNMSALSSAFGHAAAAAGGAAAGSFAGPIGSIAGAGLSLLTSVIGNHQRNEAQKAESELAYKRQLEAIREQNAYNSASAQMARLQAAGLNPNLMYDNGQQAAAGMQDNIAEYQPAEISRSFGELPPIGSELISSMIGLQEMKNHTAATEADIALKSVQGLNEVSKAGLNDANTKLILQSWGFNERMNPLLLTEKQAEIFWKRIQSSKTISDIRLNSYMARRISAATGFDLAQTERMLGIWQSERDEIHAHIQNYKYQNLALAGQAQLSYTNSDYLRGMLKVNFLRYYLDENMSFKKIDLDKQKVQMMRDYLDWDKQKFHENLNFQKNQEFNRMLRGFNQDLTQMGIVGINFLSAGGAGWLTPQTKVGF